MAVSQSTSEHIENSPAAAPRRNWFAAVGKIALYSFLLLSAGTLFAAQYVPEVANALSFLLPEEEPHSCCSQRNNQCQSTMAAEYASYSDGSSCCPSSSGCPASGGCPNEMLVAEVDLTAENEPQLATADNPPIPPVVD